MFLYNKIRQKYLEFQYHYRLKRYKHTRIKNIAIIYYIPKENKEKYNKWEDGFTKSIDLLAHDFSITWINLADEKPNAERLNKFDFIISKSCWNWIVDKYVRSIKGLNVPRAIMVSCSKKPLDDKWMFFYDVLWYETNWYFKFINSHPLAIHAFGINTSTFHKIDNLQRIYDVVSVGAFTAYKRQDKILDIPGDIKLVIGDMNQKDSKEIVNKLESKGVKVIEYLSQKELSLILNQSKSVYIPAEINGGGERAVLEARSCGAEVIIEPDNDKLKELLSSAIWDENYYSSQIRKGISAIQNRLK